MKKCDITNRCTHRFTHNFKMILVLAFICVIGMGSIAFADMTLMTEKDLDSTSANSGISIDKPEFILSPIVSAIQYGPQELDADGITIDISIADVKLVTLDNVSFHGYINPGANSYFHSNVVTGPEGALTSEQFVHMDNFTLHLDEISIGEIRPYGGTSSYGTAGVSNYTHKISGNMIQQVSY